MGLLDADWDVQAQGTDRDLDSAANRDIARDLAEESIILLSNDGVLPLAPGTKVALIGPCGDDARTFLGCYSFPNHIMSRYEGAGLGIDVPSLADSLRDELGSEHVVVAKGVDILEVDTTGIDTALEAARASDIAIVAVGDLAGLFGRGTSGEGCDVVDLRLPGVQGELVEQILATGTPVILLVISGRPYALGAYADRCAAIVQAFMPGAEGAGALVRVLTGQVNPSGRLPIGIPNHTGGQPGTYLAAPLAWHSDGVSNLDPRPLFPFGHGLSYTTFGLSDLKLSATEVAPDGTVDVSVTVTNTGDRAGSEVVQLYLGDPVAQVTRPIKQLIGYAKVPLELGQAQRVTFEVHMDRTSFTGIDLQRIVEPGAIELSRRYLQRGPTPHRAGHHHRIDPNRRGRPRPRHPLHHHRTHLTRPGSLAHVRSRGGDGRFNSSRALRECGSDQHPWSEPLSFPGPSTALRLTCESAHPTRWTKSPEEPSPQWS